MDSKTKPRPVPPHSHPTIMAWLSSVQDTFCDKSDFWAEHTQPTHNTTLPAGYFRHNPERMFLGATVHKKFLSSGTSGTNRATALFSKQGLELYKQGALATFHSVLRHYWHDTSATGLSLIDRSCDAPDSSLAAMIGWFAEAGEIAYTTAEAFRAEVLQNKARLYVWGTVANYLQLFKCYDSIPLPTDSIVFETGGIKAIGANIDLEALHQQLAKFFQLKQTQIVSEYGMCEIASQAYRFGDTKEFRFPVWVLPRVQTTSPLAQHASLAAEGTGSLVLYDGLRSDYPYFFCTEDRAALHNKRFHLLGRVSNSPLRGCSLDYVVDADNFALASKHASAETIKQIDMQQRVNTLLPALLSYLRSDQAKTALAEELANPKLAASACADILASLPDDWLQALARSLPQSELRKWLYILPASHSLVGLYPLCFGYCLGLTMLVKLTERRSLPLTEDIIALLNSLSPSAQITQVKIQHDRTSEAIDALLCYGSDATIVSLQKTYPSLPLAGFGTHDTAIVIAADELHDLRTAISKDVCALGQRGCFAAKILFCIGTSIDINAVVTLQESLSAYDLPALPALERQRYEKMGARLVATHPFQCAVLTLDTDTNTGTNYKRLLPRTGGVLPLVLAKNRGMLLNFLQRQNTLKTIACNADLHLDGKNITQIGKANAQTWDGMHEGRALFAVERC